MTSGVGKLAVLALGGLGVVLLLAAATLPPADEVQRTIGVAAVAIAVAAMLPRGRGGAVLLLVLAAALWARYLFWRAAGLADAERQLGWFASVLLLVVEVAAFWIVLQGLALRAWPLRRPPWPLPREVAEWPAVDVCVRAGEAAEPAVRASLLAALGLDWPPDRLAVWLVDGRGRARLSALADELGCGYAEASLPGSAPFAAVVAAGDMPVRAFLQLTLGWLLARPALAFVQGASAGAGRARTLVQDGADLLGAARFTGSGGVLRRAALRRRDGWRGAFLALPVVGGRALPRPRPQVEAALAVLACCALLLLPLTPPASLLAYALPCLLVLGLLWLKTRPRLAARPPSGVAVTVAGRSGSLAQGVAVLSAHGATLQLDRPLTPGEHLDLNVTLGGELLPLPARAENPAEVVWTPDGVPAEARLVRAIFSRADAFLAAVLCLLLGMTPAVAQSSDYSVRPIPGAPAETLPAAPSAGDMPAATGSRTVVYTLRQLGAGGPLALRGPQPVLGLPIGVRADEVVTAASLSLEGAISPALLPALSNVTVTLNGDYLATIPADRRTPAFTADVPITPTLFHAANRLEFRLAGRAQADCDDPLSPLLWATIADSSTLTLTLAHLPPQRDLARLPAPFFDAGEAGALRLPFVLPQASDSGLLQAAGIAASWFGQLAGPRGARFPALTALPASGDAVLLLVSPDGETDAAALPGGPAIDGPTLAVLPNPHDGLGSVLVIAGRSDAEAIAAARALAFGIRALSGTTATVAPPDIPARQPYDAPAWLDTERPARLGSLTDAAALQGSGYAGQISLPFRAPPDLFTWGRRPFALDLRWHAPPAPVEDLSLSRLDVGVDGDYLASLPLAGAGEGRVAVPAGDVGGEDTLQIAYDARPLRRAGCAAIPADLRLSIDPDSTLDLSRAYHVARLPNLAFFAAAGFPFTRLADLSQTAVVLPEQPEPAEIAAFLDAAGRIGAATGLPAAALAVARPSEVSGVADRDLLVIGTLAGLQSPGLAGLLDTSPVGFADGRLHVRMGPARPAWLPFADGGRPAERARAAAAVTADFSGGTAVLVAAESPLHAGRSVVALVGADAAALQAAGDMLADPALRRRVQGDVALLSGGQVSAWRVGPTFTAGELPFWLWPSWYLADQPLPDLALLLAGTLCVAFALAWWLAARTAAQRPPRLPDT